jgi:ketosteroid isomerase-like protein
MSGNKSLVRQLLAYYLAGDKEGMQTLLAETVQYEVVGRFRVFGKYEYLQHHFQIPFTGLPDIRVLKMTAEGPYVTTEGTVAGFFPNGNAYQARFHNAYEFKDGLLVKQSSYVISVIME